MSMQVPASCSTRQMAALVPIGSCYRATVQARRTGQGGPTLFPVPWALVSPPTLSLLVARRSHAGITTAVAVTESVTQAIWKCKRTDREGCATFLG